MLNFRGLHVAFLYKRKLKDMEVSSSATKDGGEWQKALELFYQLSDAQLQPNVISYDAILDSTKDPEVARVMFLGFPKFCDQNRCFSRGCFVCVWNFVGCFGCDMWCEIIIRSPYDIAIFACVTLFLGGRLENQN